MHNRHTLAGPGGGSSGMPRNSTRSIQGPRINPGRLGSSPAVTPTRSFDADAKRLQQRFRSTNLRTLPAHGSVPRQGQGMPTKVKTLPGLQPRNLGKSNLPRFETTSKTTYRPGNSHLPKSVSRNGGDLKHVRKGMQANRFPQRMKSGQLETLGKGDIARKVHLADQYKHHGKGDVARRLGLEKNVHHRVGFNPGQKRLTPVPGHLYGHKPSYYHGRVHPHYTKSCFRFNYFGPGFYAGIAWYPHWRPWVAWSWGYNCHPLWDPRPLWCRPIFYDPCPVWIYWQVPVWRPLPVVACGTWVDVAAAPVAVPEQLDLQLLAVRFVDPGHPEEKLGPRYRVWFRNNSTVPITTPFDVMLLAGNDRQLAAGLPGQGVRVQAIDPGDVQSVDIRLPFEVASMNRDAAGQPAPFSVLHVLIDANRAIDDMARENNGTAIPREEVLLADPAAFEVEPAQAAAGGEMLVAGEGLGPLPGQALIHVAGKEYEAEITGWYDLGARLNLPPIPVAQPTDAELILIRGDGAAANPLKIQIQPSAQPQGGPEFEKPQTFAR
ncbi:MAG: hypothetical protein JXB10_02505 [Pirellulales bacterium]|nr:hypothetical protein [Pirellulales bacterium]